jgi:hypothetical protein
MRIDGVVPDSGPFLLGMLARRRAAKIMVQYTAMTVVSVSKHVPRGCATTQLS